MQVYLIGGAVRDMLLSRPIKDKDFMVVGATTADLLAQGFAQVGADFPVFLHPHTHAEYALARTERKNGKGYQGFAVQTDGVSLQDDLARRDLTINALAIEVGGLFDDTPRTGQVVDFYGGQNDLKNKLLRHVSPAFSEDPLRVLRVARFYARFYELGFTVAPDTACLMQTIAERGELLHLSRERIWTECVKAFDEPCAFAFFELLFDLDILKQILPELNTIWQDNTTRQTTFDKLKTAHDKPLHIKFAILTYGFLDNKNELSTLCERLLTPKVITQFAQLFITHFNELTDYQNIPADKLLNLIESTKAQKDSKLLFDLIDTVEIINDKTINREFFNHTISLYQSVTINDIDKSLKGKQIGDELARLRLLKLNEFLKKAIL
ncbi:Multifunctional CCA protein [Moraxella lacunata]|uniref:Multifunctional CCA protein n=1 Tax=Moraxella lacunata TaxID=477 RepID=A0A378QIC5_MORLA|nr:tRNA nucleotidyltransferase [Moraxella lacunata]STZ00252.1 Multifunctional CCA protein [Moraxella lacunata]